MLFWLLNKVSETIFLKFIKNVLIYLYLFALAFWQTYLAALCNTPSLSVNN